MRKQRRHKPKYADPDTGETYRIADGRALRCNELQEAGYTQAEIGELLDISLRTVTSDLQLYRQTVERFLDDVPYWQRQANRLNRKALRAVECGLGKNTVAAGRLGNEFLKGRGIQMTSIDVTTLSAADTDSLMVQLRDASARNPMLRAQLVEALGLGDASQLPQLPAPDVDSTKPAETEPEPAAPDIAPETAETAPDMPDSADSADSAGNSRPSEPS